MCEYEASRKKSIGVHNGVNDIIRTHIILRFQAYLNQSLEI